MTATTTEAPAMNAELAAIAAARGVTIDFTKSRTSVIVRETGLAVNIREHGMAGRRAVRLPGETELATRARILSGYFHDSTDEFKTLKAIERAEAARAVPAEDATCEMGCTAH